jgi:ribonuclease HII
VKGDARSFAIAAASIVAKVTRDRLMTKLAERYPGYGWEHNCGYPTIDHRTALREKGVTPFHRHDFGTVRLLLQAEQTELGLMVEVVRGMTSYVTTSNGTGDPVVRLTPTLP